MAKAKEVVVEKKEWNIKNNNHATADKVYGLGVLGAIIYYIQHSDSFWMGVLGVLKALVWPAFLIYRLLEFFKM